MFQCLSNVFPTKGEYFQKKILIIESVILRIDFTLKVMRKKLVLGVVTP